MKAFLKRNPIIVKVFTRFLKLKGKSIVIYNFLKKKCLLAYNMYFPSKKIMVDIGGGGFVRKDWLNLDFISDKYAYNDTLIDINFNLFDKKPLPFGDRTVDIFYSSHTFEHIPQKYCQHIFNELYRSLKKGGVLRITVPDFDLYYQAYGRNCQRFFAGFPYKQNHKNVLKAFATDLTHKVSKKTFDKDFKSLSKKAFANTYLKKVPIESQSKNPSNHINWWTYSKCKEMLRKAGFNENSVYHSLPQHSLAPEMRKRGVNGFDNRHPKISLFVEAIK